MPPRKTTSPKPFCLVLMPFDKSFDDVYAIGIKEACEMAGAYCERIDEQIFHESILERIFNQISKADFIVADMTGKNANVFYEVGYAHALGKRTILLTQKAKDIPFDLMHYPHIVYEGKIGDLRDKVKERVEWCVQNPPETADRGTIDLELFWGDKSLSSNDVVIETEAGVARFTITVQNNSSRTFERGSYRIGVIKKATMSVSAGDATHHIPLPDGNSLQTINELETLFPQQFLSFNCTAMLSEVGEEVVTFRAFTNSGTRDYKVIIKATAIPVRQRQNYSNIG